MANYDQLAGSTYIQLPPELNNPKKGLINIKNKDDECFKRCHIRFLNSQDKHPERIKKQDKETAKTLDYRGINFPMKARDYEIVEDLIRRFKDLILMFLDMRIVFFHYMYQKNLMNKY